MSFTKEDERAFLDARPSLIAFGMSLTQNEDRTRDLVQTTLVIAWAKAGQYQTGTNIKSWLFTILRNEFYQENRKKKRVIPVEDGNIAVLSDRKGMYSKDVQDNRLEYNETLQHIDTLSEKSQEALWLVVDGFSYDEIAELTATNVGTIKSRVSRARAKLIELRDAEPDDGQMPPLLYHMIECLTDPALGAPCQEPEGLALTRGHKPFPP